MSRSMGPERGVGVSRSGSGNRTSKAASSRVSSQPVGIPQSPPLRGRTGIKRRLAPARVVASTAPVELQSSARRRGIAIIAAQQPSSHFLPFARA